MNGNRLDWTLNPSTMGANARLTVTFSVNYPAALPAGSYRHQAKATGRLNNSVFSPIAALDLIKTNMTLTETVAPAQVASGQNLTYTITARNGGAAIENAVIVTGLLAPETTYVVGSASAGGAYDSAQNAVVWNTGNMAAALTRTFTFQARVNVGTAPGTLLRTHADLTSTQTPTLSSGSAESLVVGPRLIIVHRGPVAAIPGERITFETEVRNAGGAAANTVVVANPFPTNAAYVAGTLKMSLNGLPFTALTDAPADDSGTLFPNRVELARASLPAGDKVVFQFQVTVTSTLTPPAYVNSQPTASAAEVRCSLSRRIGRWRLRRRGLMSLKFSTVLNSMLNSPKFCQR